MKVPQNGLLWRLRHNPKCLLFCLCLAGIVQGMIFTNVVISSIEKRFGWDSTQSGIIAGCYDLGSFIAVIPLTYFGGRKMASKPKYIAAGMFIIGTGSLIFASPHFLTQRYVDTDIFQSSLDKSPLMAGDQNASSVLKSSKDLNICKLMPEEQSRDSSDAKCDQSEMSGLENYKYVFILAQLLHGVGAAALITLGTTLLDESVQEKMAPVFIGIFESSFVLGPALGYVVGGRLLNIFTEFYYLEDSDNHLTPTSPQWIGAWWLGFLLILVLSYICAALISIFPAKLRLPNGGPEEKHRSTKKETGDDNVENVLAVSTLEYGRLQDIPKALYNLITNPTYMSITFGATMDAFLLAGQAAFLPKYLESQFGITAGEAAMIVGCIVVPAGAGGTLIGGFSLKKFNLRREGAIKMYIICQCLILPLYLGFLLNCPTPRIVGLTAPYPGDPFVQKMSSCNVGCDCINPEELSRSQEAFVCSLPDGLTYLSGCHAGCSTKVEDHFYGNCSCLEDHIGGQTLVASGLCPRDCNHIYLAVIIFFQILFTFMATMPGLVAGLRSVQSSERSLALGLQTMLVRGLGTVPGPILFGIVIDQTCLLWSKNEDCSGGSCRLYDNATMSHYVLGILTIWRASALAFFLAALYFSKRLIPNNK